ACHRMRKRLEEPALNQAVERRIADSDETVFAALDAVGVVRSAQGFPLSRIQSHRLLTSQAAPSILTPATVERPHLVTSLVTNYAKRGNTRTNRNARGEQIIPTDQHFSTRGSTVLYVPRSLRKVPLTFT